MARPETPSPKAAIGDTGAPARWTVRALLAWIVPYLQERSVDSPRAVAEILLSEVLTGDGNSSVFTFPRDMLNSVSTSAITTPVMPPQSQVDAVGASAKAAMDGGAASGHRSNVADFWHYNSFNNTTYNTVAPPNWTYPTSTSASSAAWLIGGNGIYPARSAHAGGVTAAMADGSVRFIGDTVNFTIYQQLGSRNDGSTTNDF